MSTTPLPASSPAADPAPDAQPSPTPGPGTRIGFWDWLSRLDLRRSDERWLGGVAAGVAERLGLDPVLVRVGFVVLGLLAGAGLLVYAVAWLLLPDRGGRIEARAVIAGEVSAAATGALVLLVVAVAVPDPWRWWSRGPLVSGGDVMSLLVVGAVVAAAVVLAPRVAGPRARRDRAAARGVGGGEATGTEATGTEPIGTEAPGGSTAWLPRRPSRPVASAAVIAAVLGLALLAATATWLMFTTPSAADLLGVGRPGSLPHVRALAAACAVAAAVIGLALVVVGATGRRGGGLGFWGGLAALAALACAVVPTAAKGQLVGSAYWRPTSLPAAQHGYALAAGSAMLDLSGLSTWADDDAEPVVIPVRQGFGHLTVSVPSTANVSVRGRLVAGQVVTTGRGWFIRGQAEWLLPDATSRVDALPIPGAAHYVVDVQGLAGEITVKRATS